MGSAAFDTAACSALLATAAQDFQLTACAECDSSNSRLMQLAEAGAPTGSVFVAERQTAGRGRLGRQWIAAPDHSMTFSLLWRFGAGSRAPEALSLAVGLGLSRALAELDVETQVKWPNDILCRGRKLAGVLIEAQPGDIRSVVIGIGINLKLPPQMPAEVASHAIALADVLTAPPAKEKLLAVVLTHLSAILGRYEAEGFAGLRDEWQRQQAFLGSMVRISGGDDIDGICAGVSDRGELLLTTPSGPRRVMTGDVSLRLASGSNVADKAIDGSSEGRGEEEGRS